MISVFSRIDAIDIPISFHLCLHEVPSRNTKIPVFVEIDERNILFDVE